MASNSGPVRVVCGEAIGLLHPNSGRILVESGLALPPGCSRNLKPSEFERLAGRTAARKWRYSVRVLDENGGVVWCGARVGCAWGVGGMPRVRARVGCTQVL